MINVEQFIALSLSSHLFTKWKFLPDKSICLDQIVTCEWLHDPENGYNDSMVWLPTKVHDCTGYFW